MPVGPEQLPVTARWSSWQHQSGILPRRGVWVGTDSFLDPGQSRSAPDTPDHPMLAQISTPDDPLMPDPGSAAEPSAPSVEMSIAA
jgi:hypothetical protein